MVAKFATLESLSFMGAKAYEVNNCEMRLLPTKPLKFGVSREAEGEGFEPPGLSASDFQDHRIKPLCHPSEWSSSVVTRIDLRQCIRSVQSNARGD